jgi:hypothetical protein
MHPLEQMQMANQALQHDVMRLLHGLTEDQLEGLSTLLRAMMGEDGPLIAAVHSGMIDQILHFRFGRCECGGKHEQAEDLLKGGDDGPSFIVDEVGSPHPDGPTEPYSEPGPLVSLNTDATQISGAELMDKYRLEIRPGDGAIVCRDCGLWYASLHDRMLKDPDDCHGCHLKSKTG